MPDNAMTSVLKCGSCGALDPGPRDACPKCFARDLSPVEVSGNGRLMTWTMIRRPPAAFREDGAYAVAVVQLDAGVQVTGRFSHPNDQLKPGARVRAVGHQRDAILFELEA